MVLWDILPKLNLVDDEETKAEICASSDYNLRSKGHIPQQSSSTLQKSNIKKTQATITGPLNSKSASKPSTNNQDIVSMEYNIVEDLKKIKANISILDLCKISHQRKLLLDALKENDTPIATTSKNVVKETTNNVHNTIVNVALTTKKLKSQTHLFC
jgi:hypothetical protein